MFGLQAVQALMIGAVGFLTAVFALKCLKTGNMEDKIKAKKLRTCSFLQMH